MFAAHRHQVVNESLCVLYVAMTRAIHALHLVIAPAKANEKTLPRTFAGLLRGGLCGETPATPGTILYAHGRPDWQTLAPLRSANDGAPLVVPTSEEEAPQAAPALTIRLRPSDGRRGRGLERLRPSRAGVSPSINVADALRSHISQAMQRGALFHAWLEQIEWLDHGEPDEAALRQTARHVGATALDIDTELQAFREMLKMPQTRRLFSRHGYADEAPLGFSKACQAELQQAHVTLRVLRERPFAIRDGDAVVHGIIDRLILFCRNDDVLAADCIDFKSDTLAVGDSASMCDAIERHRPQLRLYRQAIARQFGPDMDRITTRLLFLPFGDLRQIEA
jgi:ATP-dependent exoDNAse (exonuclease V) beta subunit